MAAIGDGSADYLRTASTFSPLTTAYSWAFWYLPTGAPASGGASRHAFALTNSTGSDPNGYDVSFAWDHNSASFFKSAYHKNSNGTFAQAQHPGTPASSGWHHIAAVFNGSTLKLYYDGIEVASVAAMSLSASAGNPELTVCAYDNIAGGYDNRAIAQLAIWSSALTAAQILSIALGTEANGIASGDLVSYSRLNDGDITTTGHALTNSGTTLNTTYFFGQEGGVGLGGDNASAPTSYGWTIDGGVGFGGENMVCPATYNWLTQGGVGFGGENVSSPATYNFLPTGGFAIGGPNLSSPTQYSVLMTGGIGLGGDGLDTFVMIGNGSFVMLENRGQAQTKR